MTVLPTVARDLDGLWLFGAASAAPLVSFVVATVVAGAWADHRGPVRPLQAGMLVFTASQVLMALAPGMAVFALGRFGSGISEAVTARTTGRWCPHRGALLAIRLRGRRGIAADRVGPAPPVDAVGRCGQGDLGDPLDAA
jgi:MFS family permease